MHAALPRTTAEEIFAILTEECGASRDSLGQGLDAFARYLGTDSPFSREFRFGGHLGFGGKFYADGRTWRVGCYPEDATPARNAMVERANERLADLHARLSAS